MDWSYTLNSILLPPGCFLIVLAIGLLVRIKRDSRNAGNTLLTVGLLGLYLSSTPIVARTMMGFLQQYPAMAVAEVLQSDAQAIVVLGGGIQRKAAEYQGETVHPRTMQRLRYGAYLYRLNPLPILLTGGVGASGGPAESDVMAQVMTNELGIPVTWQEKVSRTTFENAFNTSAILKNQQISKIMLVTHAWHMPRAKEAFESMGVKVQAAPTAFAASGVTAWYYKAWLPHPGSLQSTAYAIHEILGRWWYQNFY